MADDSGPSIPNTENWSEWTFEEALLAIIGEKGDLRTPAQATIFNFNDKPSASDWASYHAWGEYFYGVNLNQDTFDAWTTAFTTIDEMIVDIARGKRGSMDLQSLRDMETQIRNFATWSDLTSQGINTWARNLDSDDSGFQGKAASLIQWRLKADGDGLVDTYEQLTTRHGRPIADAVKDAGDALQAWNTTMSNTWTSATSQGLKVLLWNEMVAAINAIYQYIVDSGLQKGTPNYQLDHYAFGPFVEPGKEYIRTQLSNYPKGSLMVASTWEAIGKSVSDNVLAKIKTMLDTPAQGAMGNLAPKYHLATSALIEITAPPKETPPTPDPNENNGNTPPPDGNGNIPPPPDGSGNDGNIPPPPDGGGNDANIPPPDGGGNNANIPPPDGGGGNGDLNIPGGGDGSGNLPGSGDVPPPDGGSGLGDLNVPGGGDGPPGGADPSGSGAFLPLVPPGGSGKNGEGPGGDGSIGPGGDGAFEEPGGGDGVIGAPPEGGSGGDGSQLPSGAGDSRTAVPPGGSGKGAGFGSDPGKDFDAGGGLGGVGAGAGAGGGLGNGLGGGAGGFGGAGDGRDGLGGLGGGLGSGAGLGGGAGAGGGLFGGAPTQLSGGSPGANGAPGSSGSGEGGVPFFPPMMGGQGAGGDKPQERERQTWLSEDEEIWGTSVGIGSGVIGRLDEEEHELEEVPLRGPSRRRTESPRRPRPAERAIETNEAGEETSGSASAN